MNKYLTIKQASEYLHVTPNTLRKWEHKNIIKSFRTQGQHRRYTKEMFDQTLIGKRKTYKKDLLTIGYC